MKEKSRSEKNSAGCVLQSSITRKNRPDSSQQSIAKVEKRPSIEVDSGVARQARQTNDVPAWVTWVLNGQSGLLTQGIIDMVTESEISCVCVAVR